MAIFFNILFAYTIGLYVHYQSNNMYQNVRLVHSKGEIKLCVVSLVSHFSKELSRGIK
jgi:hypothetical protein